MIDAVSQLYKRFFMHKPKISTCDELIDVSLNVMFIHRSLLESYFDGYGASNSGVFENIYGQEKDTLKMLMRYKYEL